MPFLYVKDKMSVDPPDDEALYTPLGPDPGSGGAQAGASPRQTFATNWCATRGAGAFVAIVILAVVSDLLPLLLPFPASLILAILLGAIAPALLIMVWFGEAVGGLSLDRCQAATVFFVCMAFTVLYLVFLALTGLGGALLTMFSDSAVCCPTTRPTDLPRTCPAPPNATYVWEDTSICFCPGSGMNLGLGGAAPEEPLKYAAFSLFAYRTWVCDPDAVMSMALIAGAGCALVENILYVGTSTSHEQVWPCVLIAMPMHVLCQLVMGVFVSERRFVHKISAEGWNKCCNCEDPSFYAKVMLIPFWIHFFNNFVSASLPVFLTDSERRWSFDGLWLGHFLRLAHQVAWWCYLRAIYLRLQDVERVDVQRLQMLGWIPKAWNACWCYCCASDESGTRRRLDSIYEMQHRQQAALPAAQGAAARDFEPNPLEDARQQAYEVPRSERRAILVQ